MTTQTPTRTVVGTGRRAHARLRRDRPRRSGRRQLPVVPASAGNGYLLSVITSVLLMVVVVALLAVSRTLLPLAVALLLIVAAGVFRATQRLLDGPEGDAS